jgi:hypothetical protein
MPCSAASAQRSGANLRGSANISGLLCTKYVDWLMGVLIALVPVYYWDLKGPAYAWRDRVLAVLQCFVDENTGEAGERPV